MSGIVELPLSQGFVAVIDAVDAPAALAIGKWSAKREGRRVYACKSVRQPGGSPIFYRLHSVITGWSYVDHIDGDGLNNRRSNLRPADPVTNGRNRRRAVHNKSGYTGVCWNAENRRWRAYIYDHGRNIYLGAFTSPVEAARVRDAAALELHGEFARLNFPEHDGPLPATGPSDPLTPGGVFAATQECPRCHQPMVDHDQAPGLFGLVCPVPYFP